MRLSAKEICTIKESTTALDPNADIYLFGSRVHDDQWGGDIDLLILSPEEFDHFETLTSRYARVTDMLLSKVFRSLDRVEFVQGGTLIDVVNRAHKRELIELAIPSSLLRGDHLGPPFGKGG